MTKRKKKVKVKDKIKSKYKKDNKKKFLNEKLEILKNSINNYSKNALKMKKGNLTNLLSGLIKKYLESDSKKHISKIKSVWKGIKLCLIS